MLSIVVLSVLCLCSAVADVQRGGHFDQQFASAKLRDKIESKKHDQSSLVNILHRGTLSKTEYIKHFREADKPTNVEGAHLHTKNDPPVYVKDVGDEHLTTGTFLELEYINHVNYSCIDGYVDLNQNSGLLNVRGTVLGRCNPHTKTIDTLTLKYDNSFERHWTIYEYFNCTGTRVVYSKTYAPTAICTGDFKYMYQASELSHNLFPLLKDKMFIMPQGEICYSKRERILSYELHNDTITQFDTNQCWNMYYYTIVVEAVNISLVEDSSLIGQKFESRDDQKCMGSPLKVEGWILNRCESIGDFFSLQMNWIDIGRQTGFIYAGYSFYNSYDCTGLPELTIYHHYGTPDICAHGALSFTQSPGSVLTWRDWSFDSHMEDYSSQLCNQDRTYHWATYDSRCVMKGNEKVQFNRCLRYNQYQRMDDEDLNPFTSFQAFCHDSNGDEDNVCFHSESLITYKTKDYTYSDLVSGKESECNVPHSPQSRGVVVETSCIDETTSLHVTNKTLRVTDTHLVATTNGFQLAFSLKPGDVLFGTLKGDNEKCTVNSIRKETSAQSYFGLNCLHSEVLADGIRVSTFGDFHTLPSWYMTYVGGLVGPDVASVIGEYVSDLFLS